MRDEIGASTYRVVQKVSHYQIIKKVCLIVLKSANEIRLLRQIIEMIKHRPINSAIYRSV